MNRGVMLLKVKRERIENDDEPIVLYTNIKGEESTAAVLDELFKCCLCEELFATKTRLKSHISVFHLSYLPFRCQYCQPPMCHYSATSAEAQQHQAARHSDKPPCFFTEISETQKSQLKSILKMSTDDGPTVQQQQFQHNKKWNNVIAPQTFVAPQYQLLPLHQPFSPFPQPSIIQNSARSTPQTTVFSLSNSSNTPVLQEYKNFPVFPTKVNTEETESPRENSEVGKKCGDSDENYSEEPAHGQKAPIGEVELTCPECQFQWSDLDQLQRHLEGVHKFSETTKYLLLGKKADELAKLTDISNPPFSPKKSFKKPKMSAFAETRKSHGKFDMKMCNLKSKTCAKCSQLVGCTHQAEHVWAKHLQVKPYVCTLCPFRSAYVMNMLRHCGTHDHVCLLPFTHVEFIDESANYTSIFEKMVSDCFSPETNRSRNAHSKKQSWKSENGCQMQICNLCSTPVQRRAALNHVWGKHMAFSMQCSNCDFKGHRSGPVQRHIDGEHAGEGARIVSIKSLLRHEAFNMKQRCFGDDLDELDNSAGSKLNSSKYLTGNHLTISCFYCPYETGRKGDLTKHTRKHHPENATNLEK